MDNYKNILIVKLSAIGDVIHTLPVAHTLRNHCPDAEITWIVEEKSYDILRDNPVIDQVITLPKESWKKRFKKDKWGTLIEIRSFFKELKKRDFDLAIDFQGLFKSGLITYLSGAPKRLGYRDGRELSPLFYNRRIEPPSRQIAVIDRYLQLIEKGLNLKSGEVEFDISILPAQKIRVKYLLSETGIDPDSKLIVINPFTSWESKNWLPDRYAELADKILSEGNFEVVFTGSEADREKIDGIQERMNKKAHNLAGKTGLKELAYLYQKAALFIGGDTGPMHLAAAVKTPVLALMGPTDPVRNGPYGDKHIIIQKDIDCKNCWLHRCKSGHRCMKLIRVEEVYKSAQNILVGQGEVNG